jgi:hypothetical protein
MRFKVTWSAWLSFFFFVAATSFDALVDRASERKRENAAAHLGHNTITISGVKWCVCCALGIFFRQFYGIPRERRPHRRVFVFGGDNGS